MKTRSWNRPLPKRTLLSGGARYPSVLPRQNPGWILHHIAGESQSLMIEPFHEDSRTFFQLFPRFSKSSLPVEESSFDSTPYLENFSWDWIEFRYRPYNDLDVRFVCWVPDSNVICGEYWVTNQTAQNQEILADMVCTLFSQGTGNQIEQSEIDGRPMLTGTLGEKKITLFVAGNPVFRDDPFPILQNKLSIEAHGSERIRWVCIISDSRKAARKALKNVLELDWIGEIAQRKIKREGELEIRTGDPGWDFALAHTQTLGLLRYHQLISQDNGGGLNPIQGLMMLQAITFPSADMVKKILDLVYNQPGQLEDSENIPEPDQTPPLLAGELLWQVHQLGFSDETWLPYLEKAVGKVDDWFSPDLDTDRDGIPELIHPKIFDLAGSRKAEEVISSCHLLPYPYLESPALGAILYNDLCKIYDLLQISGSKSADHFRRRSVILLNFLRDSLNPESSEFQNRDSRSHGSSEGFNIFNKLVPGVNILRQTFPQPTRIGVLHHRSSTSSSPGDFSIVYHGLDWQGNHRIEEHRSGDFFHGNGIDWGISECVYSKLEYCILKDKHQSGQIELIAPSTSIGDITQSLPLWAGALPEQHTRKIIENILLNPDRCWSPYGFSSRKHSDQGTMYLFWNFLLGQSIHNLGMIETAAELVERWMGAVTPALEVSGSIYPAYGVNQGEGLGQKDSLESLFPIRFFLQVLGIEIIQDNQLSIAGRNPFPWPVTLNFRGLEIRRERKQTVIKRPGRETINLPEGDDIQFDLY